MAKKVNINCAHCGEAQELVHDMHAIPGVPGTYVSAGEGQHLNSAGHGAEVMKKEAIDKLLDSKVIRRRKLKIVVGCLNHQEKLISTCLEVN
jgi:hypothetical protein